MQTRLTLGHKGEEHLVRRGVDDRNVDNVGPRLVARRRERQHDDPVSCGNVLELLLDAADRRSARPERLQIPQVLLIGDVPLPELLRSGKGMIATQRDEPTLVVERDQTQAPFRDWLAGVRDIHVLAE